MLGTISVPRLVAGVINHIVKIRPLEPELSGLGLYVHHDAHPFQRDDVNQSLYAEVVDKKYSIGITAIALLSAATTRQFLTLLYSSSDPVVGIGTEDQYVRITCEQQTTTKPDGVCVYGTFANTRQLPIVNT